MSTNYLLKRYKRCNIWLILGGEEIDVTNENKAEYVQLYVNYVLNSSCKTHFDAFKEGFLKVVNKQVLQLFSAKVKKF